MKAVKFIQVAAACAAISFVALNQTCAQVSPLSPAFSEQAFVKAMKGYGVKSIRYENDVFKLKVDNYLDTIKILRSSYNGGPFGYGVKNSNNDTIYMFTEMRNSKIMYSKMYDQRNIEGYTIDSRRMKYTTEPRGYQMDTKLYLLALVSDLKLRPFKETAFIEIQ